MLTPSEQWTWDYCPLKDRLLLKMDDNAPFISELTGAVLNQKVINQPLSINEAESFWRLQDVLQHLIHDENARFSFCLHALASRFRQLTAHKSWYFATQRQQDIGAFQLVHLQGKDTIPALVISSDLECIECLLLSEGESLAGKMLAQNAVIRVLRNRAQLIELELNIARSA